MLKLFLANDNYFKNIESILLRYKVMYKYMYVISYILYHLHKLLENWRLITFQVKPNSTILEGLITGLTEKWWHTHHTPHTPQQVASAREPFHTIRCSSSRRMCQHGREAWELLHKKVS